MWLYVLYNFEVCLCRFFRLYCTRKKYIGLGNNHGLCLRGWMWREHSLSWCKRQRDLFDDDLEDLDEPTSIINCENWVDVEKYKQRWAERVNIWRQRYYKIVKIYILGKMKGPAIAEAVAINCCAKVEATPFSVWDVFVLEILRH